MCSFPTADNCSVKPGLYKDVKCIIWFHSSTSVSWLAPSAPMLTIPAAALLQNELFPLCVSNYNTELVFFGAWNRSAARPHHCFLICLFQWPFHLERQNGQVSVSWLLGHAGNEFSGNAVPIWDITTRSFQGWCDYMQRLNWPGFMACSFQLLKMRLISHKSNAYFISVGDRSAWTLKE